MVKRDLFTDLVHRELDDDLSPAEQARLQALLQESPERRDFRQRLRRLDETLQQVPDEAPPGDLRQHVMQAVAFKASSRPRRGGRDVTARRKLSRLLYPLAAALAGLSLVTLWWWTTGYRDPGLQAGAVSGAMVPVESTAPWLAADEARMEGLQAQARLFPQGNQLRLEITVDSQEAVQVVVSCQPLACLTDAALPSDGPRAAPRSHGQPLTWTVDGNTALQALFAAGGRSWTVELSTQQGARRMRLELTIDEESGGTGEAS